MPEPPRTPDGLVDWHAILRASRVEFVRWFAILLVIQGALIVALVKLL
jgi:hypothetical protein